MDMTEDQEAQEMIRWAAKETAKSRRRIKKIKSKYKEPLIDKILKKIFGF